MIFVWMLASPAERRVLGARPLRGPTPWVIAIMTFSMMLVAAAGLALSNTARRREGGSRRAIRSRSPTDAAASSRCFRQSGRARA